MGGTTEKGASGGTGHTRPHMTETPLNRLAVLGVLAGIGTGLLVAALNRAIVATERLVYGVDHLKALDPGSQVTPLRLAITLVVVGIITSWSWYLLNRFGRPAVSVPGTMNGTPMPLWETLCSVPPSHLRCGRCARWARKRAPRGGWTLRILDCHNIQTRPPSTTHPHCLSSRGRTSSILPPPARRGALRPRTTPGRNDHPCGSHHHAHLSHSRCRNQHFY